MNIADCAAARHELKTKMESLRKEYDEAYAKLDAEAKRLDQAISIGKSGFNLELISLAESVLAISGLYQNAGKDRGSVISDAVAQISTGKKMGYQGLWFEFFGTKNYASWSGQRSDHTYGYGPKHGSTCFSIGLNREVRSREVKELTAEEREACVYYLLNIEEIQKAKAAA